MAPRTILHTGTGGVGATSVAAATAHRLAAAGTSTLLLSLDPAQGLADILLEPLTRVPRAIAPGLDAAQVLAQDELERRAGALDDGLGDALVRRGVDRISAVELVALPGMDELFGLLELRRHREAGRHEAIVVDCGGAARALRMLALPDVARWWLEKVVPQRSAMTAATRPIDVKLPRGGGAAQRIVRELIATNELLRDHERTSVRLVLTADRPAVAAAQRAATGLALYDLPLDAVIVNRLLGAGDGATGALAARAAREAAVCADVEAAFAPVPVMRAALLEDDVLGPAPLERLGEELFRGADAGALLHEQRVHDLEVGASAATLRLDLPFSGRDEIDVKQVGIDLLVRAGAHKRTIALPPALADYRPQGATFTDGALHVTFARTPVSADE